MATTQAGEVNIGGEAVSAITAIDQVRKFTFNLLQETEFYLS
jgi:hypothetical protein